MSSFNFSDYDYEDETPRKPEVKAAKPATDTTSRDRKTFFEEYEQQEPKNFFGQYAHLTQSEYDALSPEKKKELQNYVPLTGFAKGVAKGASAGFSELIPALQIQEEEKGAGAGELFGVVAPISLAAKAISYPFKALQGLTNFGRFGSTALRVGQSTATGATYGAAREAAEAAKGNEFSGINVAKEAATFGALHSVFEAGTQGYQWLKSLRPAQQSEMLVKGVIPEDLTPNQYKFYQDEIIPDLQRVAEEEYQAAYQKAIQENDQAFELEMANTKANHEADLYKKANEKKLSAEEFEEAQKQHQNKLKQIAAEHEKKVAEIEKQNQQAQQEFQQQQKEYDTLKKRQAAVEAAISPKTGGQPLQGRVAPEGEDVGFRPSPPYSVHPTLQNRVGNIISPNRITNTTNAGRTQIEAVRANDAIDYGKVHEAYQLSEELNAQVEAEQGNLVNELRATQTRLSSIPDPSPPQKQLLATIDRILGQAQIVNDFGEVVGLNPINNRTLQEQAKSMRYFMDFNFEHGNSRGIFSPTVRNIEDAIESSARSVGNDAAVEANREARRLYSEWAEAYDNPYIKPYRDTSNLDFSKTFQSSLETDNFNPLNNILNRSNAGQQVAASTRRALVDKKLSKFFDNPRSYNRAQFDEALSELEAVISPEQSREIRNAFADARRTPVIEAKKVEKPTAAEKPKTKELPQAKIPPFTEKPKKVKEIMKVRVPNKNLKVDSPEMKAAAKKMDITPEQAMSKANTPSGLKELKKDLSPQLFERLGKQKIKDILYEGNVQRRFTGKELYTIINKGNNYAMLSEILGEDVAADMLINAEQISDNRVTVDALKRFGMKLSSLKILMLFGVL